MTRRCIINVAVGDNYVERQAHLVASLDAVGEKAERLFWTNEWPAASHAENPYAFKVDAFTVASIHRGFDQILWLDSPVRAVKPLDLVWETLESDLVLLLEDGWNCGQWTSDAALQYFRIDRDGAMMIPQIYACLLGLNARSGFIGVDFLDRWRLARNAGVFRGAWTNANGEVSADPRCLGHRHDQTCASIIAHQMGLKLQHLPTFLSIDQTEGDPIFRSGWW